MNPEQKTKLIEFVQSLNIKLESEYIRLDRFANVFKCKIVRDRKQYTFPFTIGKACKESEPEILTVLYSLLLDASAFHENDFHEFIDSFGCTNEDALKMYNDCEKTYKALNRLFSSEELEQLRELFEDF